jgi:hypothetical protein
VELQSVDEAGEHFGNLLEVILQHVVLGLLNEPAPPRDFQHRDAFLNRSPRDAKETLLVGRSEAAIAFGDVGGYRQRRAIDLVCQEVKSAREFAAEFANTIRKNNRFLINEKFLECEGHWRESRRK